jgi:hypothetical protein
MPSWDVRTAEADRPVRRVRHEVRDGLAVIGVSLATSTAVVVALALLVKLAG